MKKERIEIYWQNLTWENSISDFECRLLNHIIYRSKLSKQACTESNPTLSDTFKKSVDTIKRTLKSLEDKGWIIRVEDFRERSQRRIEVTKKCITLVRNPFDVWETLKENQNL